MRQKGWNGLCLDEEATTARNTVAHLSLGDDGKGAAPL